MNEYKSALNKIKASNNFKNDTIKMLSNLNTTNNRKINTKIISVLAASLVIVITAMILLTPFLTTDHSFVIKAGAHSITDSSFTEIADISASMAGFIGLDLSEVNPIIQGQKAEDKSPKISNKAFFCLNIEGEDVESIKYELSNGFFELGQGLLNQTIDNSGIIEENLVGMQDGFDYVEHFTLDYSNQFTPIGKYYEGDWVAMNVLREYDETVHKKLIHNLLNLSVLHPDKRGEFEDEDYFESVFEDFLNEMYKDTEIYVTCKFKDGTEKTKTLKLYADCEITGTKEEYYYTGDNYDSQHDGDETYELYEVYDYTIKLLAKSV